MTLETFNLNTRDAVIRFDTLLDSHINKKANFSLKHISLIEAYDHLQPLPDGGRTFSALLDFKINFLLLFLDLNDIGCTWNQLFSKGKLKGGSVLDSEVKFFGKMNIHRSNTAYVLRYRALWDKLMGLILLVYAPNDYDAFANAKSKKRTFAKLAEKHQFATPEFLENLSNLLTKFDNTFRTSEAHGTGVLRKYSFTMENLNQNPQIELIHFWNALLDFVAKFGKIFSGEPTPTNPADPSSHAKR